MSKKLFLIYLFSASYVLWAQNSQSDATSVLYKTAQRYNVLTSYSLKFIASMDDPVVKSIKMNGVLFVKGNKYFLTLDDQTIANDGTMMWNYQKSINEASIFDAEDDDFLIYHPMRILNNWDKDYNAKIIREEGDNEKVIIIVDLTPKQPLTFYKMRLFIEKSTSYLQRIMIYQMDAPTITYSITKFTSKDSMEDSKFTFNKNNYPNVQVNDMR